MKDQIRQLADQELRHRLSDLLEAQKGPPSKDQPAGTEWRTINGTRVLVSKKSGKPVGGGTAAKSVADRRAAAMAGSRGVPPDVQARRDSGVEIAERTGNMGQFTDKQLQMQREILKDEIKMSVGRGGRIAPPMREQHDAAVATLAKVEKEIAGRKAHKAKPKGRPRVSRGRRAVADRRAAAMADEAAKKKK